MKKYGKFAALIVVVIGTLVWLATSEMKENQTYYKTITELGQMGNKAYGARVRVGGDVETGSIRRVGSRVEFVLAQETTKLKVAYTGADPLPDTFKDGAQALADGKLGKDGVFVANRIQAKCASKYEAKPGQIKPGQTAPNINSGKASIKRAIWKIWVRWPSCWPSVWRCMPRRRASSAASRANRFCWLAENGRSTESGCSSPRRPASWSTR